LRGRANVSRECRLDELPRERLDRHLQRHVRCLPGLIEVENSVDHLRRHVEAARQPCQRQRFRQQEARFQGFDLGDGPLEGEVRQLLGRPAQRQTPLDHKMTQEGRHGSPFHAEGGFHSRVRGGAERAFTKPAWRVPVAMATGLERVSRR
jgi:hypothetical protein